MPTAPSAITVPSVGHPTRQEFAQALIDWITFFNALVSTHDLVLNGSFEQDSDADGVPDAWTKTLQFNGAFLLDQSTALGDDKAVDGVRSAKFTSIGGGGNGGGALSMEDYAECSENRRYIVTWQMKGTAGVKNLVQISWFDSTKSFISATTLYNEAVNNPTAWTMFSVEAIPPDQSRYFKLTLTGCDSTDSTAGSTWFDNVRVLAGPRRRTAEQFDSSGTWTCPLDVTYAFVECIGAGGGGDGGGGGEYRAGWLPVIPGRGYTITRGAGGSGNGGDSVFQDSVTTVALLVAIGGNSSSNSGTGGTGGTGGTIAYAGQTGINDFGGKAGGPGGAGGRTPTGTGSNNGHAPGGGSAGTGTGANGRVIVTYGLDW